MPLLLQSKKRLRKTKNEKDVIKRGYANFDMYIFHSQLIDLHI